MQNINIKKLVDAGLVQFPEPKPQAICDANKPKRRHVRKNKYNKNSKAPMNLKAAELYLGQKTLKEFCDAYNLNFERIRRGAYQGKPLGRRETAILAIYNAQERLSTICDRLGANLASTSTLLWHMRKVRINSAKAA
jgi:hypothetical protein